METPALLQNAQRLRYEALSNFATNLNRASSYRHVCDALAAHVKYIIDFYVLRLVHRNNANEWCFEVSRGECRAFRPRHDAIREFEDEILTNGLPVSFTAQEVEHRIKKGADSILHPKVSNIYSLPANYIKHQHVIITAGVKNDISYIDLDFKFLRSIADLVANKLLQLDLLKKTERNNRELKQKNTEITRLNHDLEQMVALRTAELTGANDELRTLFYRTSHDFRAPLANILGLANLARVVCKDDEALALFEKCEDVVHRLDTMLSKLNVLSTYLYETQIVQVDFSGLLSQLKDKYQQQLKSIGGRIVFDVNLSDAHIANPHTYLSIFDNLIENAIQYHRENLLIQVYVFQYQNDLVIKVSDNGQGIPTQIINRIYEMYYRGHADSAGSGLGLYVVRKLVKSLQGDIFVQSKPEHYTHFIIKVPFKQPLQ